VRAILLAACLVVGPWVLLLALWWPEARREWGELVRREGEGEEERD
jgi:hypothetical protein